MGFGQTTNIFLHSRCNRQNFCFHPDAIRSSPSNGIQQTATVHNSFDHCLHRSCAFDRVDGCVRSKRFATYSLCVLHEELQKLLLDCRLSLCGVILNYTTITNLRCHSHRASCGLNKGRIITAKQTEL